MAPATAGAQPEERTSAVATAEREAPTETIATGEREGTTEKIATTDDDAKTEVIRTDTDPKHKEPGTGEGLSRLALGSGQIAQGEQVALDS